MTAISEYLYPSHLTSFLIFAHTKSASPLILREYASVTPCGSAGFSALPPCKRSRSTLSVSFLYLTALSPSFVYSVFCGFPQSMAY